MVHSGNNINIGILFSFISTSENSVGVFIFETFTLKLCVIQSIDKVYHQITLSLFMCYFPPAILTKKSRICALLFLLLLVCLYLLRRLLLRVVFFIEILFYSNIYQQDLFTEIIHTYYYTAYIIHTSI